MRNTLFCAWFGTYANRLRPSPSISLPRLGAPGLDAAGDTGPSSISSPMRVLTVVGGGARPGVMGLGAGRLRRDASLAVSGTVAGSSTVFSAFSVSSVFSEPPETRRFLAFGSASGALGNMSSRSSTGEGDLGAASDSSRARFVVEEAELPPATADASACSRACF
ncbi:hypothetical protein BKA80DRAFT_302045 [Phyllosticta citrichinensis]